MKKLLISLISAGSLFLSGCLERSNNKISFVEGEVVQRIYRPAQSGVTSVPFFIPFPGGFVAGARNVPYYNPEVHGVIIKDNNQKLHEYRTSKEFSEACKRGGTWVVPCTPREYDEIINSSNR